MHFNFETLCAKRYWCGSGVFPFFSAVGLVMQSNYDKRGRLCAFFPVWLRIILCCSSLGGAGLRYGLRFSWQSFIGKIHVHCLPCFSHFSWRHTISCQAKAGCHVEWKTVLLDVKCFLLIACRLTCFGFLFLRCIYYCLTRWYFFIFCLTTILK